MFKREMILLAWDHLAQQERFANMTLSQFQELTLPSEEVRTALRVSRAQVALLARTQVSQASALRLLLKRVVNSVRCDATQGEESALYRSMGFVPTNERGSSKRSKLVQAGSSQEPESSGEPQPAESRIPARGRRLPLRERYQKILMAWERAGGVPLPGVAIEELRAAGEAYETSRTERLGETAQRSRLIGERTRSDQKTVELMRQVVAGVIASEEHGINSALYRAMGYIPNDERKPRSRAVHM